jgi:DNA repair exonuclease SbcCD ATPase subunit
MKSLKVLVGLVVCTMVTGLAQGTRPGAGDNAEQIRRLQNYINSLRERLRENRPVPPERPLPPGIPDDVKKMIEEARKAAQDFATSQRDLVQQLRDAAQEEREEIRAQMKANLETFKEAQKSRVEDIKKRLVELRQEFRNNRDRVLDAARENGGRARGK